MTIQPTRHECHACCLLRAGFLAFQPVVDNTRGTRVGQVVSSFQKVLWGSQLTWYFVYIHGGTVLVYPQFISEVCAYVTCVCNFRPGYTHGVSFIIQKSILGALQKIYFLITPAGIVCVCWRHI